jgi:ABC-type glycerol-3-phosphate transport system substrate-binding protein
LKLQRTGRISVAALAVAAALGMSACGSGDKHSSSHATMTTTSAAASATTAANRPPVPTAVQLNQELKETLDPNVPSAQKVQYVQDGTTALQKDPQMINKLITAYQQNNAKITVTGVTDTGDPTSISATANFSINGGQNNVAVVPFVVQDGKWVLQLQWACNGLKNLNQSSPACT